MQCKTDVWRIASVKRIAIIKELLKLYILQCNKLYQTRKNTVQCDFGYSVPTFVTLYVMKYSIYMLHFILQF